MPLVLVVDDEFGIAKLLEDVLEDEGYTVVVASNGKQALDHAIAETPALVLTDFMMPVMDGAALLNAMAANPTLANVPIVIMSSMPEETIAERCSGYAKFVRKPFKIFDMIDIVSLLLKSKGGR
ncbi:response regulator [Sphingomonas sp. PAMC 26617]|uniref:response regulator n=1 Tax=Sphingomonas sp. PAMC 26617 TaxID=1112216 RepID=UPI0002898CA4|nr:response regulator [Sphingomonas sp. PAMC 26617]